MESAKLASYFDHTLLKATAGRKDIENLCKEALVSGFASVCVNPFWVDYCARLLKGSPVAVCTVIGFPLGANSTHTKVKETRDAVKNGAQEVDMVINVGAIKSGDWDLVHKDVSAVVKAARKAVVKVILETCYLTDQEKIQACEICVAAGADFVKTSTGFGTAGASEKDVKLMKETVGLRAEVKASGGIRSLKDTLAMIEAGAARIGASAGMSVLKELAGEKGDAGDNTGY